MPLPKPSHSPKQDGFAALRKDTALSKHIVSSYLLSIQIIPRQRTVLPAQPQCPPQCLQSPPHCKDFPFFLSRIMLRTIRHTIPTKTAPTTNVPMSFLLFQFHAHYTFYFAPATLFIFTFNVSLSLYGRNNR